MDEKELFSTWNQSGEREKQALRKHEGEYEKLAQKSSNDIFDRIRKNIQWEISASIIVMIGFPFFFLKHPVFLAIIIALLLLSAVASFKVYREYLNGIRAFNQLTVIESLGKKLEVLKKYIRHLHLLIYLFAPIAFAVGFTFELKQGDLTAQQLLFLIAFSLPFLALFIWLCKKYIHALYGKHYQRLKSIYSDLSNNNSEDL